MRVLSKKVAVLAAVCIIAVLLFAGCDSGLKISEEKESIEINGWSLSSPEGMGAIRAATATSVEAAKVVQIDGILYQVQFSGDAESVLDRVYDPLFFNDEVDYNDPDIKAYLQEKSSEECMYDGSNSITISFTQLEGAPLDNSRASVGKFVQITSGYMGSFYLGCLGPVLVCNAAVPSSFSSTNYACNIACGSVIGTNPKDWSIYGVRAGYAGITYTHPVTLKGIAPIPLGVWYWAFELYGLNAGYAQLNFSW